MDGSLESRTGRAGTGRSLLAALICSALISVAAYSGAAAAQEADACAFLIDFGNGRAQWVDVPVTKGMTGFHVFENATRTLGLSETHAYEAPWGNTIMSIDGTQATIFSPTRSSPTTSGGYGSGTAIPRNGATRRPSWTGSTHRHQGNRRHICPGPHIGLRRPRPSIGTRGSRRGRFRQHRQRPEL